MTSNRARTLAAAGFLAAQTLFAADVIVFNGDGAGEGFNDPTPAVPVGGNAGTTVGLQRQIAFLHAASVWGAKLESVQPIRIIAFFNPLNCNATSAVVGAAAPAWSVANSPANPGFPGLQANTWYPVGLAEKRTGADITSNPPLNTFPFEMFAQFNSSIGTPGCLTDGGWYYGLDTNTPVGKTNLVTVLIHEFAHGLGFTVGPTNGLTGARAQGLPSIWESFLKDQTTGKLWLNMTNAERTASAINNENLVWSGLQVASDVPQVLDFQAEIELNAPGALKRTDHTAQRASFGPQLTQKGIKDNLMIGYDQGGLSPTDGCEPFSTNPSQSVKGRIAMVDRGNCTFVQKVKNAQDAGAVAVVIANNIDAGLPGMGGVDSTITIPSIGITKALGDTIRGLSRFGGASRASLPVTISLSEDVRLGTTGGFVRMYAPAPFQAGSSVSHFDPILMPNQLMEPFISSDLTFNVTPPFDLTLSLLTDIGW